MNRNPTVLRHSIACLCIAAATAFGGASAKRDNDKPEKKADAAPAGTVYVEDDLSDPTRSSTLWAFASCELDAPHGVPASGKGGTLAYPQLGQASRKGYCAFTANQGEKFLRFVTMPFDRRDADRQAENFRASVDWRKGGAEIRPRRQAGDDGKRKRAGWDLDGNAYLRPDNTVAYRWDFRLSDVSMLMPNDDGTKLAGAAVVGQFHSQTSPACNAGGRHVEGFSPAPGLSVRILTDKKGTVREEDYEVLFTLSTKLTNQQAKASGLSACDGPGPKICDTVLWSQKFRLADVASLSINTNTAPWITISYSMRPSKSNGAMQFQFGIDPSRYQDAVRRNPQLAYAKRDFTTGSSTLSLPLTQNDCPNVPFLGSYVLGYPIKYYGYPSDENYSQTKGERPSSAQSEKLIRGAQPNPSKWVNEEFAKDYGRFIRGEQKPGELPPQFVVDYRAFRLTQEKDLR